MVCSKRTRRPLLGAGFETRRLGTVQVVGFDEPLVDQWPR